MKILLVNPPIPRTYYNKEFYMPLSLLCLAAAIRQNGDEPEILDLKIHSGAPIQDFDAFYDVKLVEAVSASKPEMIGFGCLYSGQFPDIIRYSELLKARFPKIPIVLGGIHPTIYPKEILADCPSVDWIIIGEGEDSFTRFVNKYKKGEKDFSDLDGFAYREGGAVRVNPKTKFIEDLDALPMPAYDLVRFSDYYVDTSGWYNPRKLSFKTTIPMITSRSCPNRCSFCSMYRVMGPKWRAKSPENVMKEIEYLYHEHGIRHFSFMDDNMTLTKSHILSICGQIEKKNLEIEFETPNGISIRTLDEEVLDAMVSSGLVRLSLAIESGSDFIRNKVMGKRLADEKIHEIVKLVKKYKDLYVRAFFIIGMPEETEETLEATYEMIKEADADRVYIHNIVPYPGTALYRQAVKDDLLVDLKPEEFYKTDKLYLTNFDTFFIKPYKLTLRQLIEFRKRCQALIDEMARSKKERKAAGRDE